MMLKSANEAPNAIEDPTAVMLATVARVTVR